MMLDCDEVYERLRSTLLIYARELQSVKIEIFAREMEFIPGTNESSDPALLDEFNKVCPGEVTLSEAYALAATYVENEIVKLRHEKVAGLIVAALRAASREPQSAAAPLLRWRK